MRDAKQDIETLKEFKTLKEFPHIRSWLIEVIQYWINRVQKLEEENRRLYNILENLFDAWEAYSTCLAPQEAINDYYTKFIEDMNDAREFLEGGGE